MFNLKKIIVACSLFYYVNASYAQYNLVKAEKIPPMMEVLQVDNR